MIKFYHLHFVFPFIPFLYIRRDTAK